MYKTKYKHYGELDRLKRIRGKRVQKVMYWLCLSYLILLRN